MGEAIASDIGELDRFFANWPFTGSVVLWAKEANETRSFSPDEQQTISRWAREMNDRGNNLYFHLNETTGPLKKKAAKADIAAVHWLHVDIDPRAGEDLAEEQDRIRAQLTGDLPSGVPGPPTAVIFSGGGYQAFWRLSEPIPTNGDKGAAAEAERYIRQLELLFGADNCHNVDRVMRLPGTVNWPDEKKQKKGRVPALARLERCELLYAYETTQFEKAPKLEKLVDGKKFAAQIDTRQVQHVTDLATDGRLAKVSDAAKIVIAQGHDPDKPNRHESRSEWLFFACCELVRAECDDDTIFAIITDPAFRISESVSEKGKWYAIRQIERARENAIAPELREMNDKHAVILKPKTRVLAKTPDEIDPTRENYTLQTFEDIRNGYCNTKVQTGSDSKGNPIMMPKGKWWLEHEHRATYEGLRFRPDLGQTVVEGNYLNLWRGFGIDPASGEWPLMQHHIQEVLAAGCPEHTEYIMRWSAWAVQNPDKPAESALVFRGGKGTGKGWFGRAMRRLFGQHGMQIASSAHLTGQFNDHLRDCSLLFADEAVAPDDSRADSRLKNLITEPEIVIEGKGEKVVKVPNRLHIVMASNEEYVVRATKDERRYAVFNVSEARKGDKEYFDALAHEVDQGGLSAMLHDLLSMDLGKWHPRWNIPDNDALANQKELTVNDPWLDFLSRLLGERDGKVRASDLWGALDIQVSLRSQRDNDRLGRVMKALGFYRTKLRFGGSPEHCYVRGDSNQVEQLHILGTPGWVGGTYSYE